MISGDPPSTPLANVADRADINITENNPFNTSDHAGDSGTFSVKVDDFTPEHDFNYPQTNAFVILLVVLSAILFYLGWNGSELKWVKKADFYEQPGFWSLMSLGGMVVFGLGHQLTHVILKTKAAPIASGKQADTFYDISGITLPIEYALYFVAYVWLVPRLGYLPTTLIAMPLLTWRAGYRELKWYVLSILFAIGIVVLFKSVLQVRIPGGEIYEYLPDSVRSFFISRL